MIYGGILMGILYRAAAVASWKKCWSRKARRKRRKAKEFLEWYWGRTCRGGWDEQQDDARAEAFLERFDEHRQRLLTSRTEATSSPA